MYLTICTKQSEKHFGFSLTKINQLATKTCAKNDFYIIILSDLELLTSRFTIYAH